MQHSSKVLIIGGNGFLGKELAAQYTDAGHQVFTASRSSDISVELSSLDSLLALADTLQPEIVIHCASAGRKGDFLENYHNVYRLGCQHITHAFKDAKQVVFTSSTSVYGQNNGEVVDESSPTEPESPSAQILLDAEEFISNHANGLVLRLSGIYGHKSGGRSYLIKQLLAGDYTLEEHPNRLLNHIHHVDAARACLHLTEQSLNGVYNISESNVFSKKETLLKICAALNIQAPEFNNTAEPKNHKAVSNKKLMSTGFSFQYPEFSNSAKFLAQHFNV